MNLVSFGGVVQAVAHSSKLVLALLAVLLLVVAAIGPARTFEARSVPSASCPSSGGPRVVERIRVPGRPGFLVLTKHRLWAALAAPHLAGRGAIALIDPRSARLERVIRLPVDPHQIVFAFGSLWVTGDTSIRKWNGLLRIDPKTGNVLAVIRARRPLGSKIAATADAIWINGGDIFPVGHGERADVRFVYRIDPRRNAVVRRFQLPQQATVIALAGAGRALWSVGWWGVVKLSPSGRVLFRRSIDGSGWALALTPGVVWVAQPWYGTRPVRRQDKPARRLLRIPTSGSATRTVIELDFQPGGVSAAGGLVWVGGNNGVVRLDAADDTPTKVQLGVAPNYLQAFRGGAWISELRSNRVSKVC